MSFSSITFSVHLSLFFSLLTFSFFPLVLFEISSSFLPQFLLNVCIPTTMDCRSKVNSLVSHSLIQGSQEQNGKKNSVMRRRVDANVEEKRNASQGKMVIEAK